MSTNNACNFNPKTLQQVRSKSNTPTTANIGLSLSLNPLPSLVNTQFLTSLTITPFFAASTLLIEFFCPCAAGDAFRSVAFFLFNGTMPVQSIMSQGGDSAVELASTASLVYAQTAGSTSPITFTIQYATNASNTSPGNTSYINRTGVGQNFGGTMNWSFFITEITN